MVAVCSFSVLAERQISAESTIKSVKVFLNGAQVSRSAGINLENGITEIVLGNLPAGIDNNSIAVSGAGDFTILSVVYELNYIKNRQKTLEIKILEDSLEELTMRLSQLQNTQSAYQEEQNMILANKNIGGQNTGVNAKQLEEMANFMRSRLGDIKKQLLDLNLPIKKLSEQITHINQQLSSLNAKSNQPSGTITVTVSAKAVVSGTLDISYYARNAGWSPFYDIRAKDAASPVQIGYRAKVYQNTGEDWKAVKLQLSSSNPSLGGKAPELLPWYLNFYTPQPVYKNKAESRAMMVAPAMAEKMNVVNMDEKPQEAQTPAQSTTLAESHLSNEFDIAIPYSVPSDGKNHLVEVQNYEVNAAYSVYAAPKLDKDAFLIAKITGWEDLNLLPGEAAVYFENAYIGESNIGNANTNDTLSISLGRDKKVIIKREKQKDYSSNQLFAGNKIKSLAYEISVKNIHKEAVMLMLEDQIPISSKSEIEVKTIDLSGAELNAETGKVSWKINLAPSETQKRKFSFSVRYPKDKTIIW